MSTTMKRPSRLAATLLETAAAMRDAGLLDAAAHEKITLRHLGRAEPTVETSTGS